MNSTVEVVKIVDGERFEAAEARRLASLTKAQHRHDERSGAASDAVEAGGWSARSIKTAQAYWWVPAGFAVLVLLNAILGT